MTYDRAAIFRIAWAAAKSRPAYHRAQDWTPGPNYGRSRPVTAAERRAIFAACLRQQWACAQSAMKHRRAALAAFPVPRPVSELEDLLFALDCTDFQRARDTFAIAALRQELDAARLLAA
ncbi:hypothetical protein [Paracoccus ravus]|uniref:hypothetical protein n=1 Tax=Paracoccus ravus TaxID=2447760 RepID=UPI00106EFFB0|nr:hypothetical protein [Paracoccus ravus]